MKRIDCLALHIACICMRSMYDPILGQRFVFERHRKMNDIDKKMIIVRKETSHPWKEKRIQNKHLHQGILSKNLQGRMKKYNRTQKK